MTYSIVARDPDSGEMGVAVQSHWFGVGPLVGWARAGVGVVATQAAVDCGYGPRGLALMESGLSAEQVLTALLSADLGSQLRQVACLDAQSVGVHTGAGCIAHASHQRGEAFSVQANLMANPDVVPAMAAAFEEGTGALAERMLGALEAAERAGGDLRRSQSASLLVVAGRNTARPWPGADHIVDLRVADHPNPIGELRRLLGRAHAYASMAAGDAAMESQLPEAAMNHFAAAHALAPDEDEVRYWLAVNTALTGDLSTAREHGVGLFVEGSRWRELTKRLVAADLVSDEVAAALLM